MLVRAFKQRKNLMSKSKQSGIMGGIERTSSMNMEGKHAKALKGHKVGDQLNIMVSGKKSSHYQNADGSHSIGFNIDRVEVHQDPKDSSGPNKKASNNQQDGGKIV